jgi:hypothetical protein
MDLWKTPNSENGITFNDHNCKYRSRSYYCQPIKAKKAKPEPPKPEPPKKCAKAISWLIKGAKPGLCGQQWDFVTDSKKNLLAIKKNPTQSGKTEVHRLTASSNYQKFDLHIATGLHLTNEHWAFTMDSKDNLVGILKGPKTGSGKTEVHRLTASSRYTKFDLHTPTALGYTNENMVFTMDSKDNLVGVLKGPKTGSGKTEVHRLSASSGYKQFNLQTGTGLHYSSGNGYWDFKMDPQDNLVCILKGPTSGSGKTEVHKLSGSSNFKKFNLHTATALHYTTGTNWDFAMAGNDLVGILKGPISGTCRTEVHKLSGSAKYGKFNLQKGTPLHLTSKESCAAR